MCLSCWTSCSCINNMISQTCTLNFWPWQLRTLPMTVSAQTIILPRTIFVFVNISMSSVSVIRIWHNHRNKGHKCQKKQEFMSIFCDNVHENPEKILYRNHWNVWSQLQWVVNLASCQLSCFWRKLSNLFPDAVQYSWWLDRTIQDNFRWSLDYNTQMSTDNARNCQYLMKIVFEMLM